MYIKDFARIVKPLHDLLRKNVEFYCGDEQQKAFDKLEEISCNELVLVAPDLRQPFVVTCDYRLGAVIRQEKIDQNRLCAYASKPLKISELRYSTYDKELLAIVFAEELFRHWLYRRKFTVVTTMSLLNTFTARKK